MKKVNMFKEDRTSFISYSTLCFFVVSVEIDLTVMTLVSKSNITSIAAGNL